MQKNFPGSIKHNKKFSKNNSNQDSTIDYYKQKIDNIYNERVDWLKDLEGIKIDIEDFHDKEWELKELTDKIIEYQHSLSETNIALANERHRNLEFTNEIE